MRRIVFLPLFILAASLSLAQSVKFEFTNIRFRPGSSSIEPSSYPALDSLAQFLRASEAKVEIAGHTDNQGSAAYNLRLSQRRAEAVRGLLLSKYRIPAERISAKGYGQLMPKADNATEEGRAQNRRVEIVILSKIRTARISFLQGNVFVRKQGVSRWEPASLNRILTVFDELATDSTGRAEITFDLGGRIKVKPRSNLVLSRMAFAAPGSGPGVEIGLLLGKVWAKIGKLSGTEEKFSVSTPAAVASIRGGEFLMESAPDKRSLLSVWEDEVLYQGKSPGSGESSVAAGYGSYCLAGLSPQPPLKLPSAPQPQKPATGDTLFYNPDRPKNFSFSWKPVPGCRTRLLVAKDAELNEVVAEVVTADTSYQLPAVKADRLYWQVNSIDSLGLEGQPWPLRSSEVRRKLDHPQLEITQPVSGKKIGRREVLIKGNTEAKASVSINGHEIYVMPDGSFTESLTLSPGQNVLNITAIDRAGNVTSQSLTVFCSPLKRFWVGASAGALKLVGGKWDLSKIGPAGGLRFFYTLNPRLAAGIQAAYGQVGCKEDPLETRAKNYQTELYAGSILVQFSLAPQQRIEPYVSLSLGAVSWKNSMDSLPVLHTDFGTQAALQKDLSPHAGIAIGARYRAADNIQIFLEAWGGYLDTDKYTVGHYDANDKTASVQLGAMFGF